MEDIEIISSAALAPVEMSIIAPSVIMLFGFVFAFAVSCLIFASYLHQHSKRVSAAHKRIRVQKKVQEIRDRDNLEYIVSKHENGAMPRHLHYIDRTHETHETHETHKAHEALNDHA